MKIIRQISELKKAINNEKGLGFIPTMGCLHKGHEALIKIAKKKCNKTLVTIFINPTQFNNKKDYKSYPRNLSGDITSLKKLKVDYAYIPTINQIFNNEQLPKVILNKSKKILCAKFRKGHFEGVVDILNRFTKLILPKSIFMGEKDYQQYFLVKNFIEKNYKTRVYVCKTIRDNNKIALSSRNSLLNKTNLKTLAIITNKLLILKKMIHKDRRTSKKLINTIKKELIKKFKIKIEYLECRNINNLSMNIQNKSFKVFVAYYLDDVRLIDNF